MVIPDSRIISEYLFLPLQQMKKNEDKTISALIIDDDIDTCILLSRILVEKKIKSLSVNTLHDAENLFESVSPALIFLDNKLPDGYGLNFLSFIKEKFPEAQIVMITAHSSDFNRRTALLNGAEFFIEKPFSSYDINNVINSISTKYENDKLEK
jgi:two-component system OmpR family response regulator